MTTMKMTPPFWRISDTADKIKDLLKCRDSQRIWSKEKEDTKIGWTIQIENIQPNPTESYLI
jgi:hypothetical protein